MVHRPVYHSHHQELVYTINTNEKGCLPRRPTQCRRLMNTLSDSLRLRPDLGFPLPSSTISINHLLYADYVCIISKSPAGCQHLLNQVQRWLHWAQFKIKVLKCRSMALQASTGKSVDPSLSISDQIIPN